MCCALYWPHVGPEHSHKPQQVAQDYTVLFLLFLAEVTLVIEIAEKYNESNAVSKHHHVHAVGKVTLGEEVVARVQEEQDKLDQLQGGQVFLPPQVLLHVRANGSQAVVRVHDDVDKRVDEADEERLSTGYVFDSSPPVEDHGAVVVDVKKCQLAILFPQNKKYRVTKLYDFREEKPPAYIGHPHCQWTSAIINRLTKKAIVGQP